MQLTISKNGIDLILEGNEIIEALRQDKESLLELKLLLESINITPEVEVPTFDEIMRDFEGIVTQKEEVPVFSKEEVTVKTIVPEIRMKRKYHKRKNKQNRFKRLRDKIVKKLDNSPIEREPPIVPAKRPVTNDISFAV